MADVEVPDPKEVEEKASDPSTRMTALMVAVYAVILAVTALGGSNAGKDMVMAQQKASNAWAYYQAKVMRENMYLLAAEGLELEVEEAGAKPEDMPLAGFRVDEVVEAGKKSRAKELREKKLASYRKKAETYKQEKEEIMAEARKLEEERDTAARRDPYFDYAEVLLQISIVLASVSMLSGRKGAFYASLALAALGLLLCINGYGLILKVPGLE